MFAGFGYHGDVIVAWDEGVLDKATTLCGPDSKESDIGHNGETEKCTAFTMNPVEDQQACKIELPSMLDGDVTSGSAQNLPGKVAIVAGPGYAKPDGSVPAPAQNEAVKPSPSSTAGTSASSVEGGNVFKVGAATSTSTSTASSTSSMVADSYPSSSSSSSAAAVMSSSSTPAPPPPPPAAMTPAPAAPANNADVANIQLSTITTSWYTMGQEAYEVVVVAEEVTVTVDAGATPAPGAKAKRDFLHRHGRRHGHHGGHHQ